MSRKSIVGFWIIALLLSGCNQRTFDSEWTNWAAPSRFVARIETTKGNFDVEVLRDHSPKAADRFYQLVKSGYFDNGLFYRVVPDFVAQFGNTDTAEMEQWRQVPIPDEPIRLKNTRGTLSFARTGRQSRDLEVFINLADNHMLDTLKQDGVVGFPAFGKVISGMDLVDKLYSGYGEKTMQDGRIYSDHAAFRKKFDRLDMIIKAYILQ